MPFGDVVLQTLVCIFFLFGVTTAVGNTTLVYGMLHVLCISANNWLYITLLGIATLIQGECCWLLNMEPGHRPE